MNFRLPPLQVNATLDASAPPPPVPAALAAEIRRSYAAMRGREAPGSLESEWRAVIAAGRDASNANPMTWTHVRRVRNAMQAMYNAVPRIARGRDEVQLLHSKIAVLNRALANVP